MEHGLCLVHCTLSHSRAGTSFFFHFFFSFSFFDFHFFFYFLFIFGSTLLVESQQANTDPPATAPTDNPTTGSSPLGSLRLMTTSMIGSSESTRPGKLSGPVRWKGDG